MDMEHAGISPLYLTVELERTHHHQARKLVAYHDQFEPRALLENRGREIPQDQGLSVFPNE